MLYFILYNCIYVLINACIFSFAVIYRTAYFFLCNSETQPHYLMALFLIKNLFQDLNSQFEICLICVPGPTAQYRILG